MMEPRNSRPNCDTHVAARIVLLLVWLIACSQRATESTALSSTSGSAAVASAEASPDSSVASEVAAPPGLSPATKKLACELQQPVTVHAAFTKLDVTEEVAASTRELFGWLEEISCVDAAGKRRPGQIRTKLELVEPQAQEARGKALGLGISTFAVGTDGESMAYASIVSGFCVGADGEAYCQQWNALDVDLAILEYQVLQLLRRTHAAMPGTRKPRIGIVNNSGPMGLRTTRLGQSLPPTSELLGSAAIHDLVDVDLETQDAPIDPTLPGLLLLAPAAAASEKQLKRIDDFVMLGGKTVVLVMSGFTSSTAHKDIIRSFDPLLSGYGLGLQLAAVYDHGAPYTTTAQKLDGTKVEVSCPVFSRVASVQRDRDLRIDSGFPPFFRDYEATFSFVSPITLAPERQPAARVRAVARTSAFATTAPDDKSFCDIRPPPTSGERYDIAAVAEGRLKSALTPETSPLSPQESRVLLIASSAFFANPASVVQDGWPQERRAEIQPLVNNYANAHSSDVFQRLVTLFDWMDDDTDEIALARRIPVGAPKLGPIPEGTVPLVPPGGSATR